MKTLAVALLMFSAAPAAAQQPAPPARGEVLVLGVYHMANPGRDVFNTKADDVLAPKRQAEMAELIATLKRFHPTKIAVESDFSENEVSKRYADYLAGTHELTRNEIQQIGFRLAREVGHKNVHAVDVSGDYPFLRLMKYAKATGRSGELEALLGEVGQRVKEQDAYLASHTILETLLFMNADDRVARDIAFYYRAAEFGEPWDWAGADLVSDWFRRNMRIYSNIVQLAGSPNDRVLVIYGSGHLGWLQQAFASNPNFRLRKLAELVR